MGLGRITGTRDLDDQHLLLVQAMQEVVEAITPGGSLEHLHKAWATFLQVMEDHLVAEGELLELLPRPLCFGHQEIHRRLLDRAKAYQLGGQDPHYRMMRHLFSDVQEHMHSPEEDIMVQTVRNAVKAGRFPERT